jgi:predicted signal transduction protein with EAL and GGDEF domain
VFTSLAAFAAAAALVLCLVVCGELFEKPDTLRHAALMMTDLDNLKTINDTYGHDWGDIYLRQTAHSLRQNSPGGTEEARAAGVTAFCEKPLFLSELRKVLEMGVDLLQGYCLACPAAEPGAIDEKAAEVIAEVERQKAEREEAGP